MDDYGRASTVLVSEFNTTFVPASASVDQNKIKVIHDGKDNEICKPNKNAYLTLKKNNKEIKHNTWA